MFKSVQKLQIIKSYSISSRRYQETRYILQLLFHSPSNTNLPCPLLTVRLAHFSHLSLSCSYKQYNSWYCWLASPSCSWISISSNICSSNCVSLSFDAALRFLISLSLSSTFLLSILLSFSRCNTFCSDSW